MIQIPCGSTDVRIQRDGNHGHRYAPPCPQGSIGMPPKVEGEQLGGGAVGQRSGTDGDGAMGGRPRRSGAKGGIPSHTNAGP